MHVYKYLVTIGLPCSECGLMSAEAIREILHESTAGIPSSDITVEDISDKRCHNVDV
jgi:hypothetical protein